jgi:uncharacterized protein involved in exopolysaccharide biosynthesis
VQSLEDNLVVDPIKKTDLIRVSYVARDPQLSAQVLQTLAGLYKEKHAAVHRPEGAFSFFDQQTSRYRDQLATAEEQLSAFDEREGIVAPAAQKQLALEQLSQFSSDLERERSGAFAASERARALRQEAGSAPERQTTQIRKLDNGELLAELQSTLLSLELKRSDMLVKYEPSYPPVQDVEAQISETQSAIRQARENPVAETTTDRAPAKDWIATELAKAEADQAELGAQAAATGRAIRQYQEIAQEMDRKSTIQDDLARNVKTSEDNYLLYLRKREEARISDALDSKRIVDVSIAEAATVPALPTLHMGWLLISGFFTASIISVGGAYAADRLDPSFRTADELSRCLGVTVLASIPERAIPSRISEGEKT